MQSDAQSPASLSCSTGQRCGPYYALSSVCIVINVTATWVSCRRGEPAISLPWPNFQYEAVEGGVESAATVYVVQLPDMTCARIFAALLVKLEAVVELKEIVRFVYSYDRIAERTSVAVVQLDEMYSMLVWW